MSSTWRDIPIVYGQQAAKTKTAALLRNAKVSTQRIALFGDSRSTSPNGKGTAFVPLLNYRAITSFTGGVTGETPATFCSSFGGGNPSAKWLMRGSIANVNTTAADTPLNRNAILPGMGRGGSTTGQLAQLTSANGMLHMLRHDALDTETDGILPTTRDYIGGGEALVYDIFGVQQTSAPSVRWRYIPRATDPNYFDTLQEEGTLTGLDGSGGVVVLSTPAVTNASFSTKPYSQMVVRIDGSETNAIVVGGRWRRSVDPGGITFSTFSLGGYRSNSLVDNHENAGQMLEAMGPWAASMIYLGINDVSNNVTAATWKTNIEAMITQIRSASWLDDENHLILLCTDIPNIGGTSSQDTQHDMLGGAAAEIADADENVLVLNTMLGCSNRGFTRDTGATFLPDSTHPDSPGADIVAESVVEALEWSSFNVTPSDIAKIQQEIDTMKIRGTFNSGSTGSTLNISFTTDAPAVASAAYMTIIPTTGPLIGRPYRIKSLADNGGGNYTATIFGELPSGVAPASGNTFEMGFVSDQIETNAPR